MRLGFTGTQTGMTERQKTRFRELVEELKPTQFHHGDCIGADAEAHDIVREYSCIKIVGHPPTDPSKRAFKECDELREPLPYMDRNQEIVEETDFLVGTPAQSKEILRSGTWSTIRRGRKRNPIMYVEVINP